MQPINNWNNVKAKSTREQLPVGGYVCRIIGAKEVTYQSDNGPFKKLEVGFDIIEGNYAGYNNDYKAQEGYDNQKWTGVIRLNSPTDAPGEEWKATTFKSFTNAIEDSNPGYHWDWNEKLLKGKVVGVLVRNEEWEYEGKTGWKTKPFMFISADNIREDKFKTPKDKPLNNSAANINQNNNFADMPLDDDLPFNREV